MGMTVKYVVLLAAFGATLAAAVGLLSRTMIASGELAVIGAKYSMAMFLIPNALSFGATAAILRERWRTLRLPQILVAAFFSAILTIVIVLVVGLVSLVIPISSSQTVAQAIGAPAMVVPGILAAQLLRLGAKPQQL